MKPSILIVDDEAGVRSALSGVLRDEGYQVDAVDSGEACLDRVTRAPYDLIVLDIWLPGMDGLATLSRLRERRVDAPVVMISGHGNIESAVRAIKMGAFDFVEKPLSLEKTVLVIGNALKQRRLEAENRALRARVDLRRERHRQGARGAHDPRAQPPARRRVRRGELRGNFRRADRERTVRPRS